MDPIFGIVDMFNHDKHPDRVNLSIGVYRTAEGKPHVFKVIRRVEEELARLGSNMDYTPGRGDSDYLYLSKQLIFGNNTSLLERVRALVLSPIDCLCPDRLRLRLADTYEPISEGQPHERLRGLLLAHLD